jgi:hypothetical protein
MQFYMNWYFKIIKMHNTIFNYHNIISFVRLLFNELLTYVYYCEMSLSKLYKCIYWKNNTEDGIKIYLVTN